MTTNTDLLKKWEECKVLIRNGRASEALDHLYLIANEGIDYAMLEIGNIFESGIGDVDQDFISALDWYGRVFEATSDPEAVLRMARIYMYGSEDVRDYRKARSFYSLDVMSKNPIALLNLGLMYEKGWGTEEDMGRAIGYYKNAIDKGSVFARIYLARVYWAKKHYWLAVITRLKASVQAIAGLFRDGEKFSDKIRRY